MIARVRIIIAREFRRLNRLILGGILLLLLLHIAGTYILQVWLENNSLLAWLRNIFIPTVLLLLGGAYVLYLLYRSRMKLQDELDHSVSDEMYGVQATLERYEALQEMAATLSATLSFERVIDQTVSVCALALEDLNVPRNSLIGGVFLFDGENLVPMKIAEADRDRVLAGNDGVVGTALQRGEPALTDNPYQDPELKEFETFSGCLTAVCVPLRAGYQLFGVMVLGVDRAIRFEEKHFHLFSAVADQTVIALQNAQLFQSLEAEKQRLIDADMEARRELARDLHDGPVQKIAAVAMRLNVLKSMVASEPQKLPEELAKLEGVANAASQELRHMMFTLRPLLLDSKGLGPAVESMLLQINERDGIETNLTGQESGQVLNLLTQNVVFAIIEEALSNARKHAQAGAIDVRLWQERDLFVAQITDDGIGFNLHQVRQDYDTRGSLGLLNMQERAERIDGSLRIDARPGAGTSITLVVPIAEDDHRLTTETKIAQPQ